MELICEKCENKFEVTKFTYSESSALVECPTCGHKFFTYEDIELEFTREQLSRLDEIYNAATEFCRVLAEDPELEEDMGFVGEIVDYAVDTLVEKLNKPIRYPGIVTVNKPDGTVEEYMEDNVMPITRKNVTQIIFGADGHRIHR